MEELKRILITHAQRYPLMQPTDAVKLIYQNEFGGGHLIRDPESCLRYLFMEYESIEKNMAVSRNEKIGNGIVRVNLTAVKPCDLEQLGKDFIQSAEIHRGTIDRFEQKLEVLHQLTENGIFSFRINDLRSYLTEYKKAGYPPVSHSRQYREAYKPSYRIICDNITEGTEKMGYHINERSR